MSVGKLGYQYRSDGMFLIDKICIHCGLRFDVLAIAPANVANPGFCDACWQVSTWEEELEPIPTLKVIQPAAPNTWDRNISIGLAILGACVFIAILRAC